MNAGVPRSSVARQLDDHFLEVADTWVDRYLNRLSFRARLRVVSEAIERELQGRQLQDGQLRDLQPKHVLDFGAGAGVFSAVASGLGAEVISLDRSWPMLRAGVSNQDKLDKIMTSLHLLHHPERIHRVAGDIEALGARGQGRFHLVLAIAVLEYVVDLYGTLNVLVSSLDQRGTLLFTVPRPLSWVRRVETPIDGLAARVGRRWGIDRLSQRSYSAMRPYGSSPPWQAALALAGAQPVTVLEIPLGAKGWRRWSAPNQLIVARRSIDASRLSASQRNTPS